MGLASITTGDRVITVDFTTPTGALAANDLVADTQEIADVGYDTTAQTVILQSIVVLDKDDQGAALDFIFLNASQSLGTEDSAPNISDANAEKVLGHVSVLGAHYLDLGGSKLATVAPIALPLKLLVGTTSLYCAISTTGTPTYAGGHLIVQFGFLVVPTYG